MTVPPYSGVPRLSHQFPVDVVLTVTAVAVDVLVIVVVAVTASVVGTIDVVEADAVVEVVVDVVVVDELQDAKTSEATMRKVSAIHIILLFM